MPTNRRRRSRPRVDMTVPAWAERLLAGERPDPYGAESSELFGWLFLEEAVPGLPSADSDAGRALWDRAR